MKIPNDKSCNGGVSIEPTPKLVVFIANVNDKPLNVASKR